MNGMTQIKTQRDKWDKILLARKSQERNERKEKKTKCRYDICFWFDRKDFILYYFPY